MYENANQLAENKLVLLYIMNKIDLALSKNQISEIVLENGLVNYFSLQQYLSELLSASFIENQNINNKKSLIITEKGKKVLSMFITRIPEETLNKVNQYIENKIDAIKKDLSIYSDYTIENSNIFMVNLKAMEDDITLIDLKVNVPTKKHAIDLCQKWKNNPTKIYNDIINTLLKA